MVGVGEIFGVIGCACQRLVVHDIVDADWLLATICAHESLATLLETVNHIVAHHRVIYIGVGDIVEVARNDAGQIGIAHLHRHHVGLSGTDNHTEGVVAVDGIDEGIVLYLYTLIAQFSCLMHGATESRGLKMDVEHAHRLAVDIDVCPHGTVVCLLEQDGLRPSNGIAAEDCHILTSYDNIGEVFAIDVAHLLVATDIGVFLYAEDIHIFALHLCQHVLGNESSGGTAEAGDIVGGDLYA